MGCPVPISKRVVVLGVNEGPGTTVDFGELTANRETLVLHLEKGIAALDRALELPDDPPLGRFPEANAAANWYRHLYKGMYGRMRELRDALNNLLAGVDDIAANYTLTEDELRNQLIAIQRQAQAGGPV